MKSLFPKVIKVRRRKGMIDLSEIGRQEQFLEAVAHKDEWIKEKFPEAVILEELPPLEAQTPRPYVRPEVNWFEVILSAISIKKYLP